MLNLPSSHLFLARSSRLQRSTTRDLAATPAHDTGMQRAEQQSMLELSDTLQECTLKDGRAVSISVCGDPTGRPVLFLHPIQGNRFMPLTMHRAAASLGLKIIALDRPGIGASSPLPNRTVQQYPADVAEVCEQMGIQQFSVFASSAGTMYALALTVAPETKDMVVGKVTLVAPWIPNSSRAPGFGGWLSLLGSWTPVPLLHIAIGFSNSRIAQQAKRRKQYRCAVKHNTPQYAAWGSWLTGSAADLVCAGVSSLKHTAHFVIDNYVTGNDSSSTTASSRRHSSSTTHLKAVSIASSKTVATAAAETDSPVGDSSSCSCDDFEIATAVADGSISVDRAAAAAAVITSDSDSNSGSCTSAVMDEYCACACGNERSQLKPTAAACGLTARPINANCRTFSLNSMTTDTFAIGTTDMTYSTSPSRSFITTCGPPISRSSSSNSNLSSMSDGSSCSVSNGTDKPVHYANHTTLQAHDKPVTELMTRSNAVEKAAFAADPSNDAIYKAMIEQWSPSLAGIIQEMQLCTERSSKLHFNYIQDVTAPARVYMGTADQVLLHSHVQHWVDSASNVELISVDGGTHDGLMHTHKVAALRALAQDLASGT